MGTNSKGGWFCPAPYKLNLVYFANGFHCLLQIYFVPSFLPYDMLKELLNESTNGNTTTSISSPPEDFIKILDDMEETNKHMKAILNQSPLFTFPSQAPEKFVQDFYTKLAHDLVRNQSELERLFFLLFSQVFKQDSKIIFCEGFLAQLETSSGNTQQSRVNN